MSEPLAFFPKQVHLINRVMEGVKRYICYGGGIRSGKTWGGLGAIILLAKRYPQSRWFIVRRDLPTLRRNTIPSFNKLRPRGFVGEINQSTWTATCTNGSEIVFFPESFKEDPEMFRLHGAEMNGGLLEEGDELNPRTFTKFIERAGSWIIPGGGPQPKPLILVTVNPTQKWPAQVFYEPHMAGTLGADFEFIPATIDDNPYIPEEYRESLKNLPPAEYDRFVRGLWRFLEDPDQLIKAEWVWAARNVEPVDGLTHMGVDVGRYGGDSTLFAIRRGNELVGIHEFKDQPIDRTADLVKHFAQDPACPVDPRRVKLDGTGIGAGALDILNRDRFRVTNVIAGASPLDRPESFFRFNNLRSQMWWEFREKLRLGLISFPSELPEKLVGDLCAPRYEIRKDKEIVVESKDTIRERIHRSTDHGDAVVQAWFDMDPWEAVVTKPFTQPLVTPYAI